MKILFQPTMDNSVVVSALFISSFYFFFPKVFSFLGLSALASAVSAAAGATQGSFSDLLSWVQLMWGCLCSDMQKPPNMRASSNISFLCLVRPFSWHIWGLRNVLRTKIHTTYPWKIQLLGLWCSKVFFSFLHPNQCGLIQGFQLGLDRLWSNCATWLFKFLCCKLENVNRFWLWISFWGGVVCSFFWGNNADLGFILFYFHFHILLEQNADLFY